MDCDRDVLVVGCGLSGCVLARHLAGWTVEIADLAAADVDGDGEVTDWDGVVLDRYLAGWNVTIG